MKRPFLIFVLPVLAALAAVAQKSSSGSYGGSDATYKLVSIKASGTERYQDSDVTRASGLALGQTVTEADFKQAAQVLGNSGMFSEVTFSYSYSSGGAKLELQLKDAEQSEFVPAHFENFVWFKDEELFAELRRRLPLFQQLLPLNGNYADEVIHALQALLDEKQLAGRVDYLRESPPEGGKLTGYAYRVTGVDFQIHDVEFPGASPEQLPPLKLAARKLIGADYLRGPMVKVAEVDYLPVYLQRGYLKAKFAATDARVLSQTLTEVQVDAIFPVTPGRVYSTSDVGWKGNTVIPTDKLSPLIHLAPGEPADAVRLLADLEGARKLYRNLGYMAARVTPEAQMDDEKGTVHYCLNVLEGAQFKMGDLEITGLDSKAKARMEDAWALHEGDPYRGDYPAKYIEGSKRLLPEGIQWAVEMHEVVNEKDKTVDVTLRFTSK